MDKKEFGLLRGKLSLATLFIMAFFHLAAAGPNDTDWIQLWDGDNLDDWEIKIAGRELNENWNNTFRSVDGNLEVNYDDYSGFSDYYGHAAYNQVFSHYLLRGEYQVWGDQVSGAKGWTLQNNGFMLHSQSMESMSQSQSFPNSLEAQLLGPDNNDLATPGSNGTMNLCTPGTKFHDNPTGGGVNNTHCLASAPNQRAPVNTGWTKVSALVLGDSIIQFFVEGEEVLTFYRPVTDGGAPVTEGYITIQAEGHPYRFRVIKLAELIGCTDPDAGNYKSYYVKSDNSTCVAGVEGCTDPASDNYEDAATSDDGSCEYTGCMDSEADNYFCDENPDAFPCAGSNGYDENDIVDNDSCIVHIKSIMPGRNSGPLDSYLKVSITEPGPHTVEVQDVNGRTVISRKGAGIQEYHLKEISQAGIYFIRVKTPKLNVAKRVLFF